VWELAFHHRALRHEENLPTVARCMVLNPKRARSVDRIDDHPYWNAIWL